MPPVAATTTQPPIAHQADAFRLAHGILIGFGILIFAISAIILRLFRFKNIVRVHYCTQLFALAMMLAGFAAGVWLAVQKDNWWWTHQAAHEILGTIVIPLAFVPLVIGYYQHRYWKANHKASWLNVAHVWSGRFIIVLGIVDGCIPNISPTIYFGVPALLIIVIYLVVVTRWELRKRSARKAGRVATETEAIAADGDVAGMSVELVDTMAGKTPRAQEL